MYMRRKPSLPTFCSIRLRLSFPILYHDWRIIPYGKRWISLIVNVMTFNLRFHTPVDGLNAWSLRKHRTAGMIRKHMPHLVGTQEGLHGMLKDLEEQLPEYGWIGTGREGAGKGEHCAILYRKNSVIVHDSGQFWLSDAPETPASKSWDSSLPRICTWARFSFAASPGSELLFYNTHLDHLGQTAREKGAALIWQSLRARSAEYALPAVLTGDFNAHPDNPAIRFLRGEQPMDGERARMVDAYSLLSEAGGTFHGFKGGTDRQAPIDYIFATPDVELLSVEIDRSRIDRRYPSDHYPVIAQVRLNR